jgi:hypothetical protein
VKSALICCPFTKKTSGHSIVVLNLARQATSDSERDSSAHDADCSEHSNLGVDDVHLATFPPAIAACLASKLRRRPTEVPSLCDQVAMPAVGTGYEILLAQSQANSSGNGLLTLISMSMTRK